MTRSMLARTHPAHGLTPKSRQLQKRGNTINNNVVLGKCFNVVQQTHGTDTPVPQAFRLCEDFNLPYTHGSGPSRHCEHDYPVPMVRCSIVT